MAALPDVGEPPPPATSVSSSNAVMATRRAGSKKQPSGAAALVAAKVGLRERLVAALDGCSEALTARDVEGACKAP